MSEENEVEEMSDIELSSDSEVENEDEDGISLIVLKRPSLVTRTVEDVELVPLSERDQADNGANFNSKPRSGIIKEYIDEKGLGVLLNKDDDGGIVLFHLNSVWHNEMLSLDPSGQKERFLPGTRVEFLMRSFRGETYTMFSEEKTIHQVVALWAEDDQPQNMGKLLRISLGEENSTRLERDRMTFMLNVKAERFLACTLVRVRGKVSGYLTDDLGIIKTKEGEKVFFHSSDVLIYKRSVLERGKSCKRLLPIGASVSVDARRVHIKGLSDVRYQALTVLAGYWPPIPFPTLLMTGNGSLAPNRDIPKDSTFYYLDLSLPVKMKEKVSQLNTILEKSGGVLEYDPRGVRYITGASDQEDWEREMVGERRPAWSGYKRSFGSRECLDTFRSNRMEEEELAVRISSREEEFRTWYTPEAWEHGGLRLKKEEQVEEGASQPKRRKT